MEINTEVGGGRGGGGERERESRERKEGYWRDLYLFSDDIQSWCI